MAPSRVMAALPAQPLSEDGIAQLQKEILDHEVSVRSHTKEQENAAKNLEKQEKRLRDIQGGKIQGSVKYAESRIKSLKDDVGYHTNSIQKEEATIKFKQGRIDRNDEVAKAREEAEAKLAEAKAAAQKSTGYNPFANRRAGNAPKPKITRKIVRVPVVPQSGVVNRPMQQKPILSKNTAGKLTQDAGVKKNTSIKGVKKPVQKEANEEVTSKEEAVRMREKTDCANPNSKEGPSAKTNKRKLTDSAGREEQGPAKKPRSNPEQTEERIDAESPKKCGATEQAKETTTDSTIEQSKRETAQDVEKFRSSADPGFTTSKDQAEDNGKAEMSNVEESRTQSKKESSEAGHPAETGAIPSKKRKASGGEDNDEAERPKKAQKSSGSDLENASNGSASQSNAAEASGSSDTNSQQKRTGQQNNLVNVFVKGSKSSRYAWENRAAGQDWVLALPKPKQIVDRPRTRPAGTSNEAYELRGLTNTKAACFANAAVQVLNQVLSYDQIEALRGNDDLSLFGKAYKDMLQPSVTDLKELRSNISITAAIKGDVKVAPYLGQLLLDMREGAGHKSKRNEGEAFVTPVYFQQVFAYGCGEVGTRLQFDGSTQEDTQEYLMVVIEAVAEEGHTFLRDLFKVENTITKKCTACGIQTSEEESAMVISLTPPTSVSSNADGKLKLTDLLDSARSDTERPEGYKCEACGASDARENVNAITQLQDHAIVHVRRTNSVRKIQNSAAEIFKNPVSVEWMTEGTQFQLGDDQYEVDAVIRHAGDTPSAGHYDGFLKRENTWHRVDDRKIDNGVPAGSMADNKNRQCALFLLRKLI